MAPIADTGDTALKPTVLLVRLTHGIITAFFLTCIAYVYYAAITDSSSPLRWAAAAVLVVEGTIVTLNGGDCPLGFVHQRAGDEKAFFELFLSKRAAKLAVPLLGAVATTGIALLALRAV